MADTYISYSERNLDPSKMGCVMMNLDNYVVPSSIDPSVWYTDAASEHGYGIEQDTHITLLYGLLDNANDIADDVRKVLKGWEMPQEVRIIGYDTFESNPLYDVVYGILDLESHKACQDAHARLSKLPHINIHPNYMPHVTLGYVQKGRGEEAMFDDGYWKLDVVTLKSRGLNLGNTDN